MQLGFELKSDEKITTYTADLTQAKKAAKEVVKGVGNLLTKTFKREVYKKEAEKPKDNLEELMEK